MGLYIDPVGETKEAWLEREGFRLSAAPERHYNESADEFAVCLVNNRIFTAAGVCFNEAELQEFRRPCGRPKTWYFVGRESLVGLGGMMERLRKVEEPSDAS